MTDKQAPQAQDEPPEQPQKKRRRWWRWLIEIAVFLVVLLAVRAYMAPDIPHNTSAITAPTLSGQSVTLGKPDSTPRVVVFWATWCGICHVEMPWLNSLAKDDPGQVIAIAMQSGDDKTIRDYLHKNHLNHLTVINDPQGRIARQYGVGVTPTLLFFGKDGHIAMAETGITSSWGIQLRLWWLRHF